MKLKSLFTDFLPKVKSTECLPRTIPPINLLSCPPGDHQEVSDPVPSAQRRQNERNTEGIAERDLVPPQQKHHGLQRGRVHAKIFCLQFTGEALWLANIWMIELSLVDACVIAGVLFPQTVYAVPILTFAFVCHPAILPMYEELKEWVFPFHCVHPNWTTPAVS